MADEKNSLKFKLLKLTYSSMEMDGGRSDESISGEMLLVAIAAGDLDSFERLYDNFSSVLYTIALNILQVPVDAEDVVQDVFVQVWEKSSEFNPDRGSALAWMVTITRRKAIDRYRSFARKSRVIEKYEVASESDISSGGSPTFLPQDLKSLADDVKSALSQLTVDQRSVIEMAFIHGMSHSEISQSLGEPLGTIKARIRRGLDILKKTLIPLS